jgi:hypothetical protein
MALKEKFMSIKITDKILSIPPYISTNWSRIAALHMKGGVLAITLVDGDTLHIPNLKPETVNLIFQHHAVYLEKEQSSSAGGDSSKIKGMMDEGEPTIRLAFGTSLDGLGGMMQHNPNQSDAPDLPPEILQKISAIAKIIAPTEELLLPKAEAACNCFHCQIARAINPDTDSAPHAIEHEVTDEDLSFQQWSIEQTGDKLFSVVNRLDEHEKYNVYLGEPVGCTCGKQGCEHILAVLKS